MNFDKQTTKAAPRLARWLLDRSKYLRRCTERMADLDELFEHRAKSLGLYQARFRYWRDALSILIRPALREKPSYNRSSTAMITNYLKVGYRNLTRHFGFSLINILGLAVGIAACGVILLYVQDELAFDRFHDKADQIYRVVEKRDSPDLGPRHVPYTAGPVAQQLAIDFPEVETGVRLLRMGRFTSRYKDGPRFYEGDYFIADAAFFDVFGFHFLKGDKRTALAEPFGLVVTESCARKYFGDIPALGETLNLDRLGDFKVTGIIADPPENSHLQFNMLLALETLMSSENLRNYLTSWESDQLITYILLSQTAEYAAIQPRLENFLESHRAADVEVHRQLALQPLKDIHFYSGHIEFDENYRKGNVIYVYIFSIIAILIALVACINYMNLAIARSIKRSREVGMRKVVGANRGQLAGQFLTEAVLTSILAALLAIFMVYLILPFFNDLYDKQLSIDFAGNWAAILAIVALAGGIGLVSGSYPAAFLSGMEPIKSIKGQLSRQRNSGKLRKSLVVVQFVLSISMIIATMVVNQQLNMFRSQHLGFNEEQLIVVDINSRDARSNFEVMKSEFLKNAAVQEVSVSSRVPGDWKSITEVEAKLPGNVTETVHTMNYICIDEDFLNTYRMELAGGRNFAGLPEQDSLAVLINEAAAAQLGLENPLGQYLEVPDAPYRGEIIGVVKDFNFRSLHEKVGPIILGYRTNPIDLIDYYTLRIDGQDLAQTLAYLGNVHDRIDQVTPIEINFLDERLQRFYEDDVRTSQLVTVASLLAIVVACMGLLGLTAYLVEQRTREVGVRKVLGASLTSLVILLTRDFTRLVLVASADCSADFLVCT